MDDSNNSESTTLSTPRLGVKKRVRKLEHKWSSQEMEKLINEVQIREGTWNCMVKDYKDRNLREALWQEVAVAMEMTRTEVTTKWNSMRCTFRAAYNKMGEGKSGHGAGKSASTKFFKALMFLEPALRMGACTTPNLSNRKVTERITRAQKNSRGPDIDEDQNDETTVFPDVSQASFADDPLDAKELWFEASEEDVTSQEHNPAHADAENSDTEDCKVTASGLNLELEKALLPVKRKNRDSLDNCIQQNPQNPPHKRQRTPAQLFCESIIPDLEDLPANVFRQIRLRVLQVINEELVKYETTL